MELDDLSVFLTAMRHGSFTKAALVLNMSQSTVSRRIHRLERELQCRLLDRRLSSISPTREGLALIRFAETTLAAEDALRKELQDPPKPEERLDIASSTTPAEDVVPPLLARFAKLHPGVTTHVHVMDSRTVETCVAERHCDVGFSGTRPRPGLLLFEPVASDKLCLVVAKGHPLADRTSVRLSEVLELPFVVRRRGSGTRVLVEAALEEAGQNATCRKVVSEVSSSHSLLAAVRASQGVGFVSTRFLPSEGVRGLRVEGLDLKRSLYMLFRPDELKPEARALIELATTVEVGLAPAHERRPAAGPSG